MEPDAAAEPAPAPGAYSWRAHRPGRYLEREGGDIWPAVWFCVKLAVLLAVGALGALLRAAVVGDSVVVHVERERRRVVGVRQVLDLDQVVVVVVVGGERKLEVYPLVSTPA